MHSGLLVHDGVDQGANAFNFHLAHIAVLHEQRWLAAPTHTRWRACGNHVTRRQREDGGGVVDQPGNAEDHVARVAGLNHFAVEAGFQLQLAIGCDFVGSHHPGAESARGLEVLARGNLLGMELPLTNAAIVVARIARHMLEGLGFWDVAPSLANNDGQFAFPVE